MAPAAAARIHLPRQQQSPPPQPTDTIPSYYGSLTSGPDPGTVAGITLGSVAGFVLLLWLVYTCVNMGNPSRDGANDTSTVVTEGTASVVTRESRRHRRSHRRSGGGKAETVEIRRSGVGGGRPVIVEEVLRSSSRGPPPPEMVDRVIIDETRQRRRSVSRSRMPPPPMRRVVGSSDEDEDDEVVVIEEHSPPPPRRRQRSRVRSMERRSSGFREVDPDRFAGGDASFVEVRRSGSHHRR
ncbi:hypothetical protein C8A00DRAFT_45780 [Chaetomidium leptoderma]|uniref:Uncharacterized protein n=1 Tax=Chaetomidium leptoderma TaxID=669021 RepID=A0AAN6VGB3_9PEZI|nr:hypothetical protein C8A00DRAFT_45780 [Chaetomidium leptoderma]